MSYRVDHNEPIPKVVERLEREHRELAPELERVENLAESGSLSVAQSILQSLSQRILRHAVEEEAVIIRVIAEKAPNELETSTEIMRYHRRITEFFNDKLPHLLEMPTSRAKQEIKDFVMELRKHHKEEEKVAFPAALKATSMP